IMYVRLQTVQVMDQYYNTTLKSVYPTLDLEKVSIQKKEQLSKAIDYCGNNLSLDKIQRIANEEQENKFNTYEQKIGLTYLYKFDNKLFTEEDLEEIQSDYQLKEIHDVVSDKSMREYFLNEVSENEDKNQKRKQKKSKKKNVKQNKGMGLYRNNSLPL